MRGNLTYAAAPAAEHSQNPSQSWGAGFDDGDPSSAYSAVMVGGDMTSENLHDGYQQYMTEGRPTNEFESARPGVLETGMHGSKRKSVDEDDDDLVNDGAPSKKHRRT